MDIGKKLKQKRQEANLTQKELAEILHVSRQTVSSWEVGRTYPDLDVLVAISELYDTPLDDLLKEDSQMVKDITEKVKKSERRKVTNIVLSALLVAVIAIGVTFGWENYRNNQPNAAGLRPNDLMDSSWELLHSPVEDLNDSKLSIESDSLMVWNDYSVGLLNPSVDPEEMDDPASEESLEKGLEDGLVLYEDLTVEVDENTYIVSAHGYRQTFERLSDTVIQDTNGTEYSKVASVSSHDTLETIAENTENQ